MELTYEQIQSKKEIEYNNLLNSATHQIVTVDEIFTPDVEYLSWTDDGKFYWQQIGEGYLNTFVKYCYPQQCSGLVRRLK